MPRRLTPEIVQQITRQVFACGNRKALDDLTRKVWREFNEPANKEGLARLRIVILARREMLEPPR